MKKIIIISLFLVLWPFQLARAADVDTFPYVEDFETFTLCSIAYGAACSLTNNWINDAGDDFDWATDAGGTGSFGTGPSEDHNPGTAIGKYLYTESSTTNSRPLRSDLLSPSFDFSAVNAPTLDFWFHMLGGTMGTLHIDVSTDGGATFTDDIISAFTDDQDLWQLKSVDLTAYSGEANVVVRFRSLLGTSFTSDMAIDDVTVYGADANPAVPQKIPTVSAWGLVLLTSLLAIFGFRQRSLRQNKGER